jgi:hypothetical protein
MKKSHCIVIAICMGSRLCLGDLVTSASVQWGDSLEFGDTVLGTTIASNSNFYTDVNLDLMGPATYSATAISEASFSSVSLNLSYFAQNTIYEQQMVSGAASFTDTFWIFGPTGTAPIDINTTIVTITMGSESYTLGGGLDIYVDGQQSFQIEFGVPFTIQFTLSHGLTISLNHGDFGTPSFTREVSFDGIAVSGYTSDEYTIFSQSGAVYPMIPEPTTGVLLLIGLLALRTAVRPTIIKPLKGQRQKKS